MLKTIEILLQINFFVADTANKNSLNHMFYLENCNRFVYTYLVVINPNKKRHSLYQRELTQGALTNHQTQN